MFKRWSARASTGVTLVLAFVVAGVLLSGCGSSGSSSTSTSTEESSTSTEASTAGGAEGTVHILLTAEIQKPMENLGEGFEKANPNAKVEVEVVTPESLAAVELTRMRSGSAPEIMESPPGSQDSYGMINYAKLGLIEDLSDQPWVNEIPKQITGIEYEGKTIGFPSMLSSSTAIYNKKVLAELGAKLPQTYGELIDLCHEATNKGITAIALGGQETFMNIFPGAALAAGTVEPEFAEKRTAEETTFAESKGWLKSLEMFNEMGEEGCFGPTPTGYGFSAAQQQVANGKALMLIGVPSFAVPVAEANPKAELAQFALPNATSANDVRIPIAGSYGMVVPKAAKDPELAKEFLIYLAENDELFAEEAASLPAVGVTSLEEVQLPPELAALKPFMNDEKAVEWPTISWPNPEVQNEWVNGIQGMLSGTGTTPEQILESMDKAWSEGS